MSFQLEVLAMRLPRVRFTLMRMMVVVAVVAIYFGLTAWMERRATRFRALYADHINKVA
jgi:hypothetical protein